MMTQYWPMAITEDGQTLHTYDSCNTLAECVNQFDIWEKHYKYRIKEAWVDAKAQADLQSKPVEAKLVYTRTWKLCNVIQKGESDV